MILKLSTCKFSVHKQAYLTCSLKCTGLGNGCMIYLSINDSPFMKRLDEEQKEINGDVRDDNQSVTQNHIITKLDDLFELAKSNEEKIRKMNKFIR